MKLPKQPLKKYLIKYPCPPSKGNIMIVKIFMYLLAIALSIAFALYLSASIGWTFVYVLVLAPIFSLIITYVLSRKSRVTLSADIDRTMLYKGETVTLKVTAKNRSIFPVPAVKVRLSVPQVLEPAESASSLVISIMPRSEAVVEMQYKAKVWGVYNIGAENAFLHDFMGFFRFAMPCADSVCEVKIFPDIPEIPGDAPLLRSAAESARFADDSEETKENDGLNLFAGMPGYTHREYTEGDPVRRINWKLSSKRDKYMVRLDDEIESIQQNIVLDTCGGNDVYENERAVEGMLAAALGLLKCGFESTVYCRFNGVYETFAITEPADVSALQTRLADYRFSSADDVMDGKKVRSRIPVSEISADGSAKAIMLYTPLFDRKLTAEISAAEEQGITCAVVSSDSVSVGSAYQVWRLNEDYSAELLS